MMTLASWLLEGLVGPWLKVITIPVLILGALTFGKSAWDKRDAKILQQGERICDARWEQSIRNQERSAADEKLAAARSLLEAERQVAEELRDDVERLDTELATVRSDPKFSAGGNCLSDGVLEDLRKRGRAKAQ